MAPKLRPSPSMHASEWKNKIKDGNDGRQYVSLPDKNGVYKWKKIKNGEEAKTPEEYYSQFPENKKYIVKYDTYDVLSKLKLISDELTKHHIYIFPVGWKKVWWFIDFAWDDATNILKKKSYVYNKLTNKDTLFIDVVSYIFFTENRLYWSSIKGILNLQHQIRKEDKKIIIDTFKKYFGKRFSWSGSDPKTLNIKLLKI